jgi:hypothetical protein
MITLSELKQATDVEFQYEMMNILYNNLKKYPDGIEEEQLFSMIEERLKKSRLKL